MIKKVLLISCLCFLAAGFVLAGCGGGRVAINVPQIPAQECSEEWHEWCNWEVEQPSEEDAFGNILETTFITIDSVTYTPTAGNPVIVTAALTLTDEGETTSIRSVKLIYSVNSGQQTAVAMTDNGNGTWTGAIPAKSAGSSVKFYIWAADTNGNVTTGAISSPCGLVAGVPDIDNSPDIVGDDADLLNLAVNYDSNYLYIGYDVQGNITGGTVDPPFLMLYGIKITNPDTEQSEGLMVGDLWINMPLIKDDETVQEEFLPMILEQDGEIEQEDIDQIKNTGMMVLDIQDLMGGNMAEGLIVEAEPEGTVTGGRFAGKVNRAALGANPSGYLRIIVLTAANASLDSFMPIPLNCTNFLTLYTSNYSYTAL